MGNKNLHQMVMHVLISTLVSLNIVVWYEVFGLRLVILVSVLTLILLLGGQKK